MLRIFLLLGLCLTGFLTYLYWHLPSMDALQPKLTVLLKEKLHLKTIHFDHLTWHWGSHLGLMADRVSLISQDGRVQIEDAQLSLRLPILDLLRTHITASDIHLTGGMIALDIPSTSSPGQFSLPATMLQLEDTTLDWRYKNMKGKWHHFTLSMDGIQRKLAAHLPGTVFNVSWNAAMAPIALHARFKDARWLPESFKQRIRGDVHGEITLSPQAAEQRWRINASIEGKDGHAIQLLNESGILLADADAIHVDMLLDHDGTRIDISQMDWQSGKDELHVNGHWQHGKTHLVLSAGTLAMSRVWPWLKKLGDGEAWFDRMHQGTAVNIQGEMDVPQSALWQAPTSEQWRMAHYHIHAKMIDGTIALGVSYGNLSHVYGNAELDEHGMKASIQQAVLPQATGHVQGTLHIDDWTHIVLNMKGQADADAMRLQSWLGAKLPDDLKLEHAPVKGAFSLRWKASEDQPMAGEATLIPTAIWKGSLAEQAIQFSGGSLDWDMVKGLRVKKMTVQADMLSSIVTLHMQKNAAGAWQLAQLHAHASTDFAPWVRRYHLPLDAPDGMIQATLSFDGSWHGVFDFSKAIWQHLLGTNKGKGEAFTLHVHGTETASGIRIDAMEGKGKMLELTGSGMVKKDSLVLDMPHIKTNAFDGSIQIHSPTADQPLKINVLAEMLDRRVLPDTIPKTLSSGAWELHTKIKHLYWDAVSGQDVLADLGSKGHGVGIFQAGGLDVADLHISNIDARFRLLDHGLLDLRPLSAELLGQKITLSAILSPLPDGGLHWQGFANIEGPFDQIIQRLDAAKLFQAGEVHALLSGQGKLQKGMPWWKGLKGRLRLKSENGRILEGGTLTKLLAASSLTDFLHYFTGKRKDLSGPGILYKRMQVEVELNNDLAYIRKMAMHASAVDMAGHGMLHLKDGIIDMLMTVRPLQNLDAMIGVIPLLRDFLGGKEHSLLRLIYHMHGPLDNAKVDHMSAKEAKLAESGLMEQLLKWPGQWWDKGMQKKPTQQ